MKNLILLSIFLIAQFGHSSSTLDTPKLSEFCPRKLESFSNIQVHQSLSGDQKKCYLSLHPRNAFETLIYRDYLFTSDGLMLVFNSLKPDEGPGSSGAREFFFFPESFQGFNYKLVGQELVLTGFNNLEIRFSIDSAQITKIDGAEVQVAKEVNAGNKGGIEFLNTTWPYLDAGFTLGNAPSAFPRRFSELINSQQQKCRVLNQRLFQYVGDDPQLKTKAEIQQISAQTCPGFNL